MRRLIGFALVIVVVVLAVSVLIVPTLAQPSAPRVAQLFTTNTPRPIATTESPPINFITNTPRATPTPSITLTPSLTPTDTPSLTSTFTPTPTFTPSPTPTDTPTPTPTPIGPFSYPEGINPLTGMKYPDDAAAQRRTLIVKISNYPPIVRPQTGVNSADVVFEVEAEGGVTRFAALYRSVIPPLVGSVRSARLLDLELPVMYNALLAYSGTSEPIQTAILASEIVFQYFSPLKGDNENAGFFRIERTGENAGLPLEHTMFLQPGTLYELATRRNVNTGYQARGFAFNETPDPNGLPANDIFIDWYGQTDARWQYDPETGRYLRYTDGVAHIDKADGQQLWADNLVIIQVEHTDMFVGTNYESLEIALWDQGPAVLVRDGQYYQGFWRRKDREPGSALQVIYGNNVPMMMKPGRTWVSIVRGFGDVNLSDQQADMEATAQILAMTPTPTDDPAAGTGD